MKKLLSLCLLLLLPALALPDTGRAQAAGCYADYKAQRSRAGALELHYGVMELRGGACRGPDAARSQIARRIGGDGWQLLRVMSIFDASGLNARQANAGPFFLRY